MRGKAGIVTGGASGIGEMVVRRLLDDGARVYAVDRDPAGIARLEKEFAGQPFHAIHGDVSDARTAAAAVALCQAEEGTVDYLVNVAGVVHRPVPLAELSEDDYDRVQSVNLKGSFLFLQAVIKAMQSQGNPGSIVNIASTAGLRPTPRASAYAAAKQGVIALTTSAALEVAASGIRINAVCPGITDTPLFRATMAGSPVEQRIAIIPAKRLGQAREVAAAVVWLLGDQASYVTGAVLPVDGGLSLI